MEAFNNQPNQNESEVSKEGVNNRERSIHIAQLNLADKIGNITERAVKEVGKHPYFNGIEIHLS